MYAVRVDMLGPGRFESTTGEWLIEGSLMADLVVKRIREAYPDADVEREEVRIYDSESAWARDAWPLDKITQKEAARG